MKRSELTTFLDDILNIKHFSSDISNNGLQVEGKCEVRKIAFAVDASLEFFEEAVKENCDFAIVHHGLSWAGSFKRLTGLTAKRLECLFANGISLYASHLPLDANKEFGNNFVACKKLGLNNLQPFAQYAGVEIGCYGTFTESVTLSDLKKKVDSIFESASNVPFYFDDNMHIKSVGIVSGGAADCVAQAKKMNLDAFITGEYSHQDYHLIKETAIPFFASGHYSTEVVGIKALMGKIKKEHSLDCCFFDIPTGL